MNALETLLTAEVAPSSLATSNDIDVDGIVLAEAQDWTYRIGNYDDEKPSLDQYVRIAQAIEAGRHDRLHRVTDLSATAGAVRLGLMTGEGEMPMTDKGLGQVIGRLRTTFPTTMGDYIRAWSALGRRDLAASLLNDHFDLHRQKAPQDNQWLIRGFGGTARAALSKGYTTIANPPILGAIRAAVTGQHLPDLSVAGGSHIGPDSMRLDMVWRSVETPDGPYGIGVSFRNNHIGEGAFEGGLLLWRGKCHNSIVIDTSESEIRIIHRGRTAQGFAVASVPLLIEAAILKSGHALEKVSESIATPIEVPDWAALFDHVLKGAKLSDRERETAIEGADSGRTDGRRSAMSVINALTYAAHQTPGMNPDRSLELQRTAGSLLFDPLALAQRASKVAERVAASTRR